MEKKYEYVHLDKDMTYEQYINKILILRNNIKDENNYMELHHIKPRSVGGTDEENNLIYLYLEEHFLAHKLLYLDNPSCKELAYAYWMMAHMREAECSPEDYAEAREAYIKAWSGENHYLFGKHLPEETKLKISQNHADMSGENNPFYGKTHSEEAKIKMSKAKKGKPITEAQRCAREEYYKTHHGSNYGIPQSAEVKRKNSEAHKKPVICITTGEVYDSIKEATIAVGLKSTSCINSVCLGIAKHAGKKEDGTPLEWSYYEQESR